MIPVVFLHTIRNILVQEERKREEIVNKITAVEKKKQEALVKMIKKLEGVVSFYKNEPQDPTLNKHCIMS